MSTLHSSQCSMVDVNVSMVVVGILQIPDAADNCGSLCLVTIFHLCFCLIVKSTITVIELQWLILPTVAHLSSEKIVQCEPGIKCGDKRVSCQTSEKKTSR